MANSSEYVASLLFCIAGCFVVEEVGAFKNYLPEFAKKFTDMGYSVHAVMINSATWLEWSQERTVVYLCRHGIMQVDFSASPQARHDVRWHSHIMHTVCEGRYNVAAVCRFSIVQAFVLDSPH